MCIGAAVPFGFFLHRFDPYRRATNDPALKMPVNGSCHTEIHLDGAQVSVLFNDLTKSSMLLGFGFNLNLFLKKVVGGCGACGQKGTRWVTRSVIHGKCPGSTKSNCPQIHSLEVLRLPLFFRTP